MLRAVWGNRESVGNHETRVWRRSRITSRSGSRGLWPEHTRASRRHVTPRADARSTSALACFAKLNSPGKNARNARSPSYRPRRTTSTVSSRSRACFLRKQWALKMEGSNPLSSVGMIPVCVPASALDMFLNDVEGHMPLPEDRRPAHQFFFPSSRAKEVTRPLTLRWRVST